MLPPTTRPRPQCGPIALSWHTAPEGAAAILRVSISHPLEPEALPAQPRTSFRVCSGSCSEATKPRGALVIATVSRCRFHSR